MKKITAIIIAASLTAAILGSSFSVSSYADRKLETKQLMNSLTEEKYTVQSGDSLWMIAEEFCPASLDKRNYIDKVMERNDMSSSKIYPGEVIIVFAEE